MSTEEAWRRWIGLALIACLTLAVGVYAHHVDVARAGIRRLPPLPADEAAHRLLPPAEPTYSTAYTLLHTLPDGRPVAYDPCRPIHYVIRSAHLPPYGTAMIQQAIAQASQAAGLKFVYDGLTTEPLGAHRQAVQARYGDRWAPVLIAFSDSRESPDLGSDVMGRGGSVPVAPSGPGSARYVTGEVRLDQDDFDTALRRDGLGYEQDRAAIMHELGHVVGLGHVLDGSQLMDAHNLGRTSYGVGDEQGLALEGEGECRTDT